MFDLLRYEDNIAVITDDGENMTYGNLNYEVENLGNAIPQKGLVFCLCENVLASLIGYVTFINKGIPAVMLDSNKDSDLVKNLIEIYQPEYLWAPDRRIAEFKGNVIYSRGDYMMIEMTYNETIIENEINPLIALCLTTSGSTGSPKFVRLSIKNLISNAKSIAEYLNISEKDRPITTLPMYYSYGLSVINSHLIKGATILLTNKSVMQKEFWSFLKEQEATSLAGVPYTYEMLRRLRFFRMELPSLKTMTQAGGKLNKDIAIEYIEFARSKGKKFIIMYGQTEATARISYLPWSSALDKYSSIGIAIPGGKLSIIDDDGNEIYVPFVDGELTYQGDNVSMGYAESRLDLALGDENHGILKTGDIAHFDKDGFYYITGRIKRFVKVWGNRCNLDTVEQLVKTITTECACGGVDDKITVFVTEENLNDKIKAFLVDKTGFHPSAFSFKRIEVLPYTASGKVDYHKLQELL